MKANAVSHPRSITIELTRGGPTQVKKIGKQKSDIQAHGYGTVTRQVTKSRSLNHSGSEASRHD